MLPAILPQPLTFRPRQSDKPRTCKKDNDLESNRSSEQRGSCFSADGDLAGNDSKQQTDYQRAPQAFAEVFPCTQLDGLQRVPRLNDYLYNQHGDNSSHCDTKQSM